MSDLHELGRRIAREQDALRARADLRAQVRERLAANAPQAPQASLRPLAWSAGLALAAAAVLGLYAVLRPAPLTAKVGPRHEQVAAGAFLEAPTDQALGLRFSDGTKIAIGPSSRARLVELDRRGAHLSIEQGHARVAVRHRPETRYRLSLGPFHVLVTGTRFDVRWNPEQDEFELDLTEGHVEVSGCVFGQGYRMSAGQRLRASCKGKRFDVVDARADNARAAATAQRSQAAALSPVLQPASAAIASASEPVRAQRRSQRALAFRALAQRGQYVQAFAEAEAAGFEALCAGASAVELGMLADAARYAGATKKEIHALELLRKRFPGTRAAALAAFSLGRVEFDQHGAYREAARWFDTYLNEQPLGPLSREARGRVLEATARAGDAAAAHKLAVAYLRDYPTGPHAALARSLAGSEP